MDNIAEDQTRFMGFDLGVDPVSWQHQLDIFVVFHNDVCHTRRHRLEQARGGVKVLIEEAAMNSLDASELPCVEVSVVDQVSDEPKKPTGGKSIERIAVCKGISALCQRSRSGQRPLYRYKQASALDEQLNRHGRPACRRKRT